VAALGVTRDDVPTAKDAGQERERIDPADLCPMDEVVVDSIEKIKAETVLPARVIRPVAAAIAKPAAVVAAVVPATKVRLAADALFDFDKAVLKSTGLASLDELVTRIKGVQIDVVIATGHTDSVGTDAYNNKLSLARAESVKAYLVSKGVDVKRVRAIGKGESQPIADNESADGRSKNRRVDVEVVPATPAAQ